MTIALFAALLAVFALVSSFITEGIKAIIGDKPKASTLINGIVSIVVGCGGTAIAYALLKIPFNDTVSIICMSLMPLACWLSSTLGYDNVMKIIAQIEKILEAKK